MVRYRRLPHPTRHPLPRRARAPLGREPSTRDPLPPGVGQEPGSRPASGGGGGHPPTTPALRENTSYTKYTKDTNCAEPLEMGAVPRPPARDTLCAAGVQEREQET